MASDSPTANVGAIIALLVLAGCARDPAPEAPASYRVDQEVRRKVFMDCLDHAPAGPQAPKYNDWAEVVSECASAAYYIAMQDTDLLPAMRKESEVEK